VTEDIGGDPGDDEEGLTVADVARLLRCSRPHVLMLVDTGLLGAAKHQGRDVRITRAAVRAYKAARIRQGDADYKAAAHSVGLYAIPDEVYVEHIARKRSTKPGKR